MQTIKKLMVWKFNQKGYLDYEIYKLSKLFSVKLYFFSFFLIPFIFFLSHENRCARKIQFMIPLKGVLLVFRHGVILLNIASW